MLLQILQGVPGNIEGLRNEGVRIRIKLGMDVAYRWVTLAANLGHFTSGTRSGTRSDLALGEAFVRPPTKRIILLAAGTANMQTS